MVGKHPDKIQQPDEPWAGGEIDAALLADGLAHQPKLVSGLLDALSALVMIVQTDGSILYVNQAWRRLTDLSVAQVKGRKVWDIFKHHENSRLLKSFFQYNPDNESVDRCRTQWDSRDSYEHQITWRRTLCNADDNRQTLIVATGWDVTDREMLKRKLHFQEQRYKRILNNVPIAIEEVDTFGVVTYSNKAHAAMHGLEPDQVVGKTIWDLDLPEKRDSLKQYFQEIIKNQPDPVPYVTFKVNPDGSQNDIEVQWNYRRDDNGQLVGLTTTLRDVTQQRLTQKELTDYQLRYERIFRASPAMLSLTSLKTGCITEVSDAFDRILGYKPDEIIGKKPSELDIYPNPEDRDKYIEDMLKHGRVFNQEVLTRHKDGHDVYGLISGELLTLGGEQYVLSFFVDITDRVHSQKALKQSEERYRALFENVPLAITVTTVDGQVLAWNNQLHEVYGFSNKEYEDINITDIYSDLNDRIKMIEMVKKHGVVHDLEVKHEFKDGSLRYVSTHVVSLNWDGQDALLAIFQDITERKLIQQKLDESRYLLQHISDNTPAIVFVYDTQISRNIYANRRYADFYGITLQQATQIDHEKWREYIHPEDLPMVLKMEQDRHQQGVHDIVQYEFRMKNADGQYRWLHAWRTVFSCDDHGKPVQFLGVSMDVTQHKTTENERQVLIDQLRQSQKLEAIGTLASGVAHDFYNLMMVINNATDYARKTITPEHVAYASLDIIEKACLQAADVTQSLRTFSRTGQMDIENIELNSLVKDAMKLIERMMPRDIHLKVEYDQSDQPLCISGNRGHLQQVLMNIILNARDAMPSGGQIAVQVSSRKVHINPDNKNSPLRKAACLTFSDTGSGMSSETVERIFEPFFTTKTREKGTGLGLAVVHGIVRDHHGRIEVQSKPGTGTKMKVIFPILGGQYDFNENE